MKTAQYPNDVVSRDSWKKVGETPNGVGFHMELVSNGADFYLLRESHHTDAQIEEAAAYLRRAQDVCALYWVDLSNCVDDTEVIGGPSHQGESVSREMWKVPVVVYVEAASKSEAQQIVSKTLPRSADGLVSMVDACLGPKLAGSGCTLAGPLTGSILAPELADAGFMRGILTDVANAYEEPGKELSDMLADICHLAHAKGIDPQEVMDEALAVFQEEIEENSMVPDAMAATQKI